MNTTYLLSELPDLLFSMQAEIESLCQRIAMMEGQTSDLPRGASTLAPSMIASWATEELAQQLEGNRTCATCGAVAAVGYHTTCDHCGRPVCGICAVQFADGVFCPTCRREPPF